jgi:hypothetical protein
MSVIAVSAESFSPCTPRGAEPRPQNPQRVLLPRAIREHHDYAGIRKLLPLGAAPRKLAVFAVPPQLRQQARKKCVPSAELLVHVLLRGPAE